MYLEGVNTNFTNTNANGSSAKAAERFDRTRASVYEQWKDWQPSQISHHGKICCEIAREWITATDYSQLNGDGLLTGPRWLRQKFKWGASSFPIFWCEAVRRDTLDCGALAALAGEIFRARGIKNLRVQLVQKFSDVATTQWTNSWGAGCTTLPWINGELIYHEGNAIETGDGKIKVWDASAGWWIDPKSGNGYGSLLAIRVSSIGVPFDKTFAWGEYCLKAGVWHESE